LKLKVNERPAKLLITDEKRDEQALGGLGHRNVETTPVRALVSISHRQTNVVLIYSVCSFVVSAGKDDYHPALLLVRLLFNVSAE
jgi:hypothetical protein